MSSGWHRRNPDSPAARERKKQYNSTAYKRERARVARTVEQGGATCWRCLQPIPPGSDWHLGHDDFDRTIIRGPEHPRCNLTAAARAGNAAARNTAANFGTFQNLRNW